MGCLKSLYPSSQKKKKIVSMNIEEIIVYCPKLYPFYSYPLNNENAHLIGTVIQ